ncbi:hypothetical protein [Deminuibacter soli]|uniref:ApeA N-terminal domain-containing protein n=1 Tax=Deminuibacter soli TaxID=2291815 RepID=A0A3E1NG25_9BACT|nr:hypothetical protein [Deminuibacter soli]RFM26748.1 hypothetical protein DXN05_17275 [Deminuibacter soli]
MIYHKQAIELISRLRAQFSVQIIKNNSPFHNKAAELLPEEDHFRLDIMLRNSVYREEIVGATYQELTLTLEKETLIANDVYILQASGPSATAQVGNLASAGFKPKGNYYFRLLMPLQEQIYLHYSLEERHFESDLGFISRLGTAAVINGEELTICTFPVEDKWYLSIESPAKQDLDSFADKAFAVLCGLGFISGHLAGEQGWYFAYANPEMREIVGWQFWQKRKTIRTIYKPVYTNPYAFKDIPKHIQDDFHEQNRLRTISLPEFSKLCEHLYHNASLRGAIILTLESLTGSLILMPAGLSVVLETLSDVILGDKKLDLKPIQTERLKKEILGEFRNTLSKFQEALGPDGYNILRGKIDNINQPTNRTRLTAPFEAVGIKLSQEDFKMLNARNDFLHGRTIDLAKLGEDRSDDKKDQDTYYAATRLYTLISMLILRWVGYDNYVVNHCVTQNQIAQLDITEDAFRALS